LAVALPLVALMAGYRSWRGRDGLGLGDIKLAGTAGAWLAS
jgi:leader peptidase (prepilin peptidase)/N-methyltransferase